MFIGAAEIAGAIGLLIPRLRAWAATGLALIMIGAVYTHVHQHDTPPHIAPAAIALVLLGVVVWASLPSRRV